MLVLETPIGAGGHEHLGGGGVSELDGEMERGFTVGDVAAVDDGGDGVGFVFLGDRGGFGADLGGIGEAGEGIEYALQGGVVARDHGFVDRAMRVLGDVHGRHYRGQDASFWG